MGFLLGAICVIVLLNGAYWFYSRYIRSRKCIRCGYAVYVAADGFEKSKPYTLMRLTQGRAFVSPDAREATARWVSEKSIKPFSRHDPMGTV